MFKAINKTIKNKANMLLHTILPSKMPNFNINNVDSPLFYIYLNKNEVAFVSHLDDKNADEIIKVGLENGEFVFYPARATSRYFGGEQGFDTFNFIQSIVLNNLSKVAEKIYQEIEFLSDKIIEYEQVYVAKFSNVDFNIELSDSVGVDVLAESFGESFRAAFDTALKNKLLEIAKINILDTPQNLFTLVFPDDIHDVEGFMQHKHNLRGGTLRSYYNRSNLANPDVVETFRVPMSGENGGGGESVKTSRELELECCIESFFLQYSPTKKMFATAKVAIKALNLINALPRSIIYSNAELKVTIEADKIIVQNLGLGEVEINAASSIFMFENAAPKGTNAKNLALKIPAKHRISLNINPKNSAQTLRGVSLFDELKIKHHIKLAYTSSGESKNLVGSSKHSVGVFSR